MSYVRKSGLLLAAVITAGTLLAGTQARGQFEAAGARRPRVENGFSDASNQMAELRQRLSRKWREDVAWARRHGRRVDDRVPPRPKRTVQSPVSGGDPYVYFPTSATNDSRFMVLAGAQGTSTLTNAITIKMAAPSGSTGLDLAIFDGEQGGLWDQGTGVVTYTLYEDGDADGQPDAGENQVSQWVGSSMADNNWSALTASGTVGGTAINPTAWPNAKAPSGNYFFRLNIQLSNPGNGTISCFKVRTSGSIRLEPQDSFNLIAEIGSMADLATVYPAYPSLTPTTYDGVWDLYAYVSTSIDYRNPARPHSFDVWDGDLDFGNQNTALVAEQDTDDPNTPNIVAALPTWAQASNPNAEGKATGYAGATGNPPDNISQTAFVRSPSLIYDVTDPSGVRYANANPSGNGEWEMFRIETDPALKNDTSVSDKPAPGAFLPAGIFQVHVDGMDLSNLNSFRFEYDILGVDSRNNPVEPLLPYLIGDTVYSDTNRNGVQDYTDSNANGRYDVGEPGEPGIANVVVSLLDDTGNVIRTATTNASGIYNFNVDVGEYSVRVELQNSDAGQPLNGLYCTSGSAVITNTVSTGNILTYDFGFASPAAGSLGDFVWLDADGDGVQDTGEPGIGGVAVALVEGGSTISTTTTDLNGFYLFTGLDATADHTYTVVVSGTPLTGLTQTYDSDGTGTAKSSTLTLTAGTSNMLQDFGFRGSGSIGDQLWNDQSFPFNNTFDVGTDVGLANVRVFLTWDYDGDGSIDMRYVTTTDVNGHYLFSGLPAATNPGYYRVKVDTNTLPYGLQLIADPDDPAGPPFATPSYSTLTLASGASNLAQDFGYRGAGSIGDFVWFDTDADGVQDAGENGLGNVTVTLTGDFNHDGTSDYTAVTQTNSSGAYLFSNLPAGSFRVTVSAPVTWTPTYDLDGTGTPSTAAGNLQPRTSNLAFDFGYSNANVLPASVGDFIWNDTDADGVQDAGEVGIAGATVKLFNTSNVQQGSTVTTTSSGAYLFNNLAAGTYYIQFTAPSGYTLSPALQGGNTATDSNADPTNSGKTANFTLSNGQSLTTIDAGVFASASVGDFIWNDVNRDGVQSSGETGISGATAKLYNTSDVQVGSTVTTTASGAYSFTGLAPGSYYVVFTLPSGYGFTPALSGPDGTIDSDADTSTGRTATFTLVAGQNLTTIDAGGFQGATLGDFIWSDTDSDGIQDVGEPGVAGVVAKLYSSNDVLVATSPATTTSGAYSFTSLAPGTYYVQFVLPNSYAFTVKDKATGGGNDTNDSDANTTTGKTGLYTLTAGQVESTVDCGLISSISASIGDFVWDDRNANGIQDVGDAGLAGVTVNLRNSTGSTILATAITDSSGAYLFSNRSAATYIIEFVLPSGYVFSPKDVTSGGGTDSTDSDADTSTGRTAGYALGTGENNLTFDAGMYKPASVGDTVWLDSNANGVQDYTDSNNNGRWDTNEPGEAGYQGATVELYTSSNALYNPSVGYNPTTTDAQGHYSFANVVSGDYYVKFTLPSGYSFSSKNSGADTSRDSDADTITGKTATFTIASGSNPIVWDAGIFQPAAVGNFIWEDTDQDGIQDAGEVGIAGAQVKLFNATTGVQAGNTATTASDGLYSFTGLTPGSYYVQVTLPSGYLFSAKNASGSTTSNDSDVAPTTSLTSTTSVFTLVSGPPNNDIDAGASQVPQGSIGDKVWLDTGSPSGTARNGIQEAGETATDGTRQVTVTLYNAATNQQVTATPGHPTTVQVNLGSTYSFTALDAGSYYVTFTNIPSGYSLSGKNVITGTAATDSDPDPTTGKTSTIVLGRGQNRTDIDAGVSPTVTTAQVGDFVWYDLNGNGIQDSGEPGIAGATVKLYNATTNAQVGSTVTTTSTGAYSFTSLAAGSYYVQFTAPSGYSIMAKDQGTDDAKDSDASATTGKTDTFTLGNGQNNPTLDCGVGLLGSIGEIVWYDYNRDGIWQSASEQGLAGVTVTLTKPDGTTVSTTTDSSGKYLFSNLIPGSYAVTVTANTISSAVIPSTTRVQTYDYDGLTSENTARYTLSAGEDVRFLNFGYSTAPYVDPGARFMTFTIGGWGAAPSGGNPGTRLHAAFTGVYGAGGVQIGTHAGNAKYLAVWTTAQAVTDYLPNGGGAAKLTVDYSNAITTSSGVLGSQLLAVRLARDFSAGGVTGFKSGLGSRIYVDASNPNLSGKTIDTILAGADKFISADPNWSNGTTFSSSTTAANFNVALTAINENYDNGTVDRGKLQ